RSIFSAEPAQISLLYFLTYLKAGGGLDPLVKVRGGAQQDRLDGGAQQLSQRMAAALGERVLLSSPVRRIEQGRGRVAVTSDRGRHHADRVIVALPPVLSARIDFAPGVPAARAELARRMPMGATIKCLVAYERAFWRERGSSGEAVSNAGPVVFTYDN